MTQAQDIIVIGAALNGLAAALALGGRNVKRPLDVVVVDRKDPASFASNSFDGRASAITAAYKAAFTKAGKAVKDDKGATAKVKFTSRAEYPSFNIKDDAPAVKHAKRAAESMGLKPKTLFSNGGLDANWFVKYGVPTVTIGAGQYDIHTVNEYVYLPEYADGCRLAVALATLA